MFVLASSLELNDRVVLLPIVGDHTSQRRTSRRVLAIKRDGDGDVVTLWLDGLAPKVLRADEKVLLLR